MSKYKGDLEAAQNRIKALENQVAELKNEQPGAGAASSDPQAAMPVKKVTKPKGGAKGGLLGFGAFILIIVLSFSTCTRACVACNSEVTDPALAGVRNCAKARAELGDDIGWSMIGCSNYKGRSGGDPINQGCHSS